MSDKRHPVGGVDRSGKVDRISIKNAVEPEQMIDVRMSYSDLKVIRDLIDKERSKRIGNQNDRMSNDLISRKEVIDILENMIFEVEKDLSKSYLLQDVRERIRRLSTVFDKAKVIDKIKVLSAGKVLNLNLNNVYTEGYVKAAKDIIKIIEIGGID